MRGFGLFLLVMTVTTGALATEPEAPPFPYTVIALTSQRDRPAPHFLLEGAAPAATPLRPGLKTNGAPVVAAPQVAARRIRGALEPDSVASFPIDSDEGAGLVSVFDARPRLFTIRTDLDDGHQSEPFAVPHRLVRRDLNDVNDSLSLSARRVRTSLD